MTEIDTHLFQDILLTQGVVEIRVYETDGEHFVAYSGLTGKTFIICISDEFISCKTACNYLIQAGLTSLITSMFPEIKLNELAMAAEA